MMHKCLSGSLQPMQHDKVVMEYLLGTVQYTSCAKQAPARHWVPHALD